MTPIRFSFRRGHGLLGILAMTFAAIASADDSVVHSPHDLSTAGPGQVRAVDESRVCIFCHAPHNASPEAPLWNRYNPTTYYRIYDSSTTDARIDQPGPASKMCLSCHDGSIALGLLRNRDITAPLPMSHTFMPSGPRNLTNDLSDDHPIGFRFDRSLANRDPQLRSPDLVSSKIELGPRGELECTACHDAHNNELGDFLRIPTREGALCLTCHDMDGWRAGAHSQSGAIVPPMLRRDEPPTPFTSMRDNACNSCHAPHSAQQPERLLRENGDRLCLSCHDGITARNMLAVANLRSGHRSRPLSDRHDPAEDPFTMPPHVNCVDCHNPHAAQHNPLGGFSRQISTATPLASPVMRKVAGVTLGGAQIDDARYEYEVCLRCHGERAIPLPDRVVRQSDTLGNIRRQILPTAASSHPIGRASRGGADTPSLRAELRSKTFLQCLDCHNNPDARSLGGGSPNGPHGSRFDHLLVDNYETADFTIESNQAYALCYQCHDRNSILANESFPHHNNHIVRGQTPCSACHAPHGVSGSRTNHSNLINFDLRIVGGERIFRDMGDRAGSCTLTCHGVRHVNFTYGTAAP